jgi:hypothetical protein
VIAEERKGLDGGEVGLEASISNLDTVVSNLRQLW